MNVDLINAVFEFGGAFVLCLSIRQVLRDREVRGLDWATMAFFAGWGLWNLFYYPRLGQWWSFTGGSLLVVANLLYLALVIRFTYWPDPPSQR